MTMVVKQRLEDPLLPFSPVTNGLSFPWGWTSGRRLLFVRVVGAVPGHR
jgi:hypothetical protein